MLTKQAAYKNTVIHWSKSQGEIMKLLEKRDIKETRFTNITHESALRNGMTMEEGTTAIMLEFFKPIQLSEGVGGTVPIKIIIPNIPPEEKPRNQAYRIFYWYLKTKFEAVESGLIEFEQEFMPHIALGKGSGMKNVWTLFKEKMLPQIASGETADVHMLDAPK